jgi:hypothetical protein
LTRRSRFLAAGLALALASPALAYLPPSSAILKRMAQRRSDAAMKAMHVQGTLMLAGEAARAVANLPAEAREVTVPASLYVKAPGRCRLELSAEGVAPADRPSLALKPGRVAAHRGLDGVPAMLALTETVCALLGEREGDRGVAHALTGRGVALGDVALGRLDGRVAYVLGGRPGDSHPQAWVDKASFQPVRLVARFGAATRDVRLLDFASAVGGDAFPRAVEVWNGAQLEARFIAEKVVANPKLPDSLF